MKRSKRARKGTEKKGTTRRTGPYLRVMIIGLLGLVLWLVLRGGDEPVAV
jgi:hypothetical protein